MLQSIYFPVRCKRSGILLAAAILLAALLAKPNASFPQSGGKVKIGLPDFSISFLSLKVAQSQRLFQSEGLWHFLGSIIIRERLYGDLVRTLDSVTNSILRQSLLSRANISTS